MKCISQSCDEKASVVPLYENARVLFQQFDLNVKRISPLSSVTPANGPVPSVSRVSSYALVIRTFPSQEAEAMTRPAPGSNLTELTLSL